MLKEVKTDIGAKTEQEQQEIMLSADDAFISEQVENIFSDGSPNNNESNGADTNEDSDLEPGSDSDSDLDIENNAGGEHEGDIELRFDEVGEDGDDNNEENHSERTEIDVQVGPQRRISKVRKAYPNKLGFVDFIGKAKKELEAKNLHITKYREKKRQFREMSLKRYIYESIKRDQESENADLENSLLKRNLEKMMSLK